jgi:hypothetical protein
MMIWLRAFVGASRGAESANDIADSTDCLILGLATKAPPASRT